MRIPMSLTRKDRKDSMMVIDLSAEEEEVAPTLRVAIDLSEAEVASEAAEEVKVTTTVRTDLTEEEAASEAAEVVLPDLTNDSKPS